MANHSSQQLKHKRTVSWWLVVLASVLLHLVLAGVTHLVFDDLKDATSRDTKTVTMRIELPEPEVEEDPVETPELNGQIVDIAEAENPERPEEADYLAEHDQVTEEETKTEQYRVNPEILDHEFSQEDELKFEDLADVNATDPSTGATVGNNRFDPDEDGALAALPSKFKVTNKDGLQRPVPSSHSSASLAGAPNNDLLDLAPEERAREGVFLAFQYPVEIPGVNSAYFLRSAVNEIRKHRGEEELDAMNFLKAVKAKMKELGLSEDFLKRPVNAGFSGGEKKRNEILQMAMLNPKLAVLDETDSGLDIDALRIVADGVNRLKGTDNAQVVITHYQRLLDYIVPDFVHVLYDGRIIKSGDKTLAHELEEKGYDWLIRDAA